MIQLAPETIKAIAREVVRQLKADRPQPRLVGSREAARILGISVRTLKRVQDRLPAVKRGGAKQARWLFDANTIADAYSKLNEI